MALPNSLFKNQHSQHLSTHFQLPANHSQTQPKTKQPLPKNILHFLIDFPPPIEDDVGVGDNDNENNNDDENTNVNGGDNITIDNTSATVSVPTKLSWRSNL